MSEDKKTGLELLREPFESGEVLKLPKGTKVQNNCPDNEKVNCKICGGWHHPRVIHLDYVGHAAITNRLLKVDPNWNWEPVSFGSNGLPAFDENGGLWIKLTICGQTRFGYGDAQEKKGPNAVKEAIGDALRNAAMRFGAALDLWHKGELSKINDPDEDEEQEAPEYISEKQLSELRDLLAVHNSSEAGFCAFMSLKTEALERLPSKLFGNIKDALIKANAAKARKKENATV